MHQIAAFSSQDGEKSSAVSSGVSYSVAKVIVKNFTSLPKEESEKKVLSLVPFVRKGAHFTIYCALSISSFFTLHFFTLAKSLRLKKHRIWLYPAVFCLIYAASDEIHQSFVSGRDGNIPDVLLDFSGALFGILICTLILHFINKLCHKKRLSTNCRGPFTA